MYTYIRSCVFHMGYGFSLSTYSCHSDPWYNTILLIVQAICQFATNQRTLTLGKYHCAADLLFILFEFRHFAHVDLASALLVWSNPNQSNRRLAVQWCFPPPLKPWRVSQRLINIFHSFSLYVLKRSLKITWTFKGHTSEPWYLLGINIAGGVCIMLWAAVCSFIIFYTLNFFCLFRIKPQVEFKGMDVCEHGEAAYPVDAWIEQQYNHNSENERPTIPKNMQGING